MRVTAMDVYRMELPLREPYHLSYRAVCHLDSVWVRVELEDGRFGWGESTPLPGYSESDIGMAWETSNRLARAWTGKQVGDILADPPKGLDGFLFCAVWTALEDAAGCIPRPGGRVPLVGVVQEREGESPAAAMQRVRESGFGVFKLKAGFLGVEQDVERLCAYQDALRAESERIRIDANQALDEDAAARLLAACIPGKVELFEQPLPVDAWDACARLAAGTEIPVMLDESITDIASLHRTAELGAASIVKLKWMKQGGWSFLSGMVACARELGLRVVLGNGVAGWIDNANEAAFWLRHLQDMQLAGEMNGYLKIRDEFAPFGFADGCIELAANKKVDIEPSRYQHPTQISYRV